MFIFWDGGSNIAKNTPLFSLIMWSFWAPKYYAKMYVHAINETQIILLGSGIKAIIVLKLK